LTQMTQLWAQDDVFADTPARSNCVEEREPVEGAGQTRLCELVPQLYAAEAAVMFGPSFLAGPVDTGQEGNFRLYPFGFPLLRGGRPLVVGGDVAVVPEQPDSSNTEAEAKAFVEWLTNEEAIEIWSQADRGYLTPNERSRHQQDAEPPPDNEDNVRVWLTYQLRHPPGDLHFDLSDDQFSVADESEPHGSWRVLAELFEDVTTGRRSSDCAIDRAIERLEAEYRGDEWPQASCTD
jgi:ABC-type glycerol-3-phosphate transport system substrate-binding protein